MTILGSVATPTHWEYERLDHVLARSRRVGEATFTPLSVFLTHGVVPRSDRAEENHNRLGEDLSKYLLVRPGDVVFNKLRTWQGGLGVADHHGIVSPAYFVCRPTGRAVPRFLHYLLRSKPYLDEFTRVSKWMPPSQFDITWDQLRRVPVLLPPLEDQQAIADFLDAETTQIDTLLSMRDRQADLLKERWIAVVSGMLWDGSTRRRQTRLKHLCAPPTSGNRDHSSFTYTADGIPCLRGLNVRRGWIERKELLRISAQDHARHLPTELKSGDIVVVRSGLAGSAAVVPFDLDGSNCVDLVVVRRSDRVLPRYLELVLNSKETQEDVRRRSTGALLSHFNAVDAADVLVPARSISEQQRVVAILDCAEDEIRRVAGMITGQIGLLRERRRALITAAVTGEIDVSTASGRGVPA